MVRHPFRARPRIESSASRDEGAPTSVYSCKSIDIIAPDATTKSPAAFTAPAAPVDGCGPQARGEEERRAE